MRVKIGRKSVRSSDDQPVAVLFTKEELQKFKSLPPGDDIFMSFPSSWTQQQAREWLEQARDEIVPRRAAPPPAPMPTPPKPEPPAVIPFEPPVEAKVVDNDELLGFLKQGTEAKPKPPPPPPEPEPEPERQTVSDEDVMALLKDGVAPEEPPEEPPKAAMVDLKATFEIEDGVVTEVEKEKDEENGGE